MLGKYSESWSNCPEMICEKGVFKSSAKFTGNYYA